MCFRPRGDFWRERAASIFKISFTEQTDRVEEVMLLPSRHDSNKDLELRLLHSTVVSLRTTKGADLTTRVDETALSDEET